MRIACLQFAPQVGDVDHNLNRADAVLSRANPQDIDLLVLPELAFSGYNFQSLEHITPYLEPTTSGITSLWARTTALKYNCVVTVGYPETVASTPEQPASPEYYNSAVTVNSEGETIANYRKSFLYFTDETWALPGPDGLYGGKIEGLGDVAMGICMDLNPCKFEAPWNAWEFAYHILHRQANLVILSMAWLTREDPGTFSQQPKEPDMDTVSYWLSRLEPIIRAETVGEIIVVLANRTGTEGNTTYAGSSAVLGIQRGQVRLYGILGRGEKELLVVDTDRRPDFKLVSEPGSRPSTASSTGTSGSKPETKDSNSSRDSKYPTPLLEDTTQVDMHPIDPIYETHELVGLGLGLGASLDTAGDQISVLSPITSSPDTPRAPTELRSNEDLFAQSLYSRSGRKRGPSDFSEDGPTRPESPKSRNVSRGPRESLSSQDRRPESRSPRQHKDESMSSGTNEGSFQYPELPPSRNASRSPRPTRRDRSNSRSSTKRRDVSVSFDMAQTSFQYPPLPPSRSASRSSSKRRDVSVKPIDDSVSIKKHSTVSVGDETQREPRSLTRRSSSKIREPRSSQSRSNSKIRDPSATPFLRQSKFKASEPSKSRHASRPSNLFLEPRQCDHKLSNSSHYTVGDDDDSRPRPADEQNLHHIGISKSFGIFPDSSAVLLNLAAKLIFGSYGRSDSPIARILNKSDTSISQQRTMINSVPTANAIKKEINPIQQMRPCSASALQENYQTCITTASFGPRSEHALRRSRSSMW